MKEIDFDVVYDLAEQGFRQYEIAEELGISTSTLSKRMNEVREKQGLLMKYRELQSLQLTSLQARILEAITPQKIEEAPLRDLILAFKVLKDKEQVLEGKPTEIKGLVHYLLELEKQENVIDMEEFTPDQFEEAAKAAAMVVRLPELPSEEAIENPEYLPKL
jgi:predicted transcriptional regulator